MKIESLGIREGMATKTLLFSSSSNVISSEGCNSVGKTTLIRCLLYSLGEDIPGTQGFNIASLAFRLILTTDNGYRLKLLRDGPKLRIVEIATGDCESYYLPFDIHKVRARIYQTDNLELSDNLLGTFYIDQDKGWTLLNRGKVIGGIHFSIEALLRGLSGTDCSELLQKSKRLGASVKKYKFMVEAAKYRDRIAEQPDNGYLSVDSQRDFERLTQFRMQEASLKRRIKALRRATTNNKQFVNYIDSMGLRIKVGDGQEVRVTRDNLVDFEDTQQYIDAEILSLSAELSEITSLVGDAEAALLENDVLIRSEESADKFDRQIVGMQLDPVIYESALAGQKNEKKAIDDSLRNIATSGEAFTLMSHYADKYCELLGVREYFAKDKRGLLTNDLKSKSGTNYQLLVFAFRLAYAETIFSMKKINLPIIVDSIHRGEVSSSNFSKCIDMLFHEMSGHQLIIATIDDSNIPAVNKIIIHSRLMEGSKDVTDLGEWENIDTRARSMNH